MKFDIHVEHKYKTYTIQQLGFVWDPFILLKLKIFY